jgi:hypothetical protein
MNRLALPSFDMPGYEDCGQQDSPLAALHLPHFKTRPLRSSVGWDVAATIAPQAVITVGSEVSSAGVHPLRASSQISNARSKALRTTIVATSTTIKVRIVGTNSHILCDQARSPTALS